MDRQSFESNQAQVASSINIPQYKFNNSLHHFNNGREFNLSNRPLTLQRSLSNNHLNPLIDQSLKSNCGETSTLPRSKGTSKVVDLKEKTYQSLEENDFIDLNFEIIKRLLAHFKNLNSQTRSKSQLDNQLPKLVNDSCYAWNLPLISNIQKSRKKNNRWFSNLFKKSFNNFQKPSDDCSQFLLQQQRTSDVTKVYLTRSIAYASMPYKQVESNFNSRRIPILVYEACKHLSKNLAIVGIFRVNGSEKRIAALIEIFNTAPVYGLGIDFTEYNDIADLLKKYLRELPEPLLSSELYPYFLRCVEFEPLTRVKVLRQLLLLLPTPHLVLFECLLDLLGKIHNKHHINQMSSANLAKIFAPNLFRRKSTVLATSPKLNVPKDVALQAIDDYDKLAKLLTFMVEHKEEFLLTRNGVKPFLCLDADKLEDAGSIQPSLSSDSLAYLNHDDPKPAKIPDASNGVTNKLNMQDNEEKLEDNLSSSAAERKTTTGVADVEKEIHASKPEDIKIPASSPPPVDATLPTCSAIQNKFLKNDMFDLDYLQMKVKLEHEPSTLKLSPSAEIYDKTSDFCTTSSFIPSRKISKKSNRSIEIGNIQDVTVRKISFKKGKSRNSSTSKNSTNSENNSDIFSPPIKKLNSLPRRSNSVRSTEGLSKNVANRNSMRTKKDDTSFSSSDIAEPLKNEQNDSHSKKMKSYPECYSS
ncbi:hypothetical protein HDU92_005449 [Lobulomyces angularis]|nr:hypothetical protein HDU92_005449 [Lobulomyces angularis]